MKKNTTSDNEVIRGEWVVITVYPKNSLKPFVHAYGPYTESRAREIAQEFQEHNLINPEDQSAIYVRREMKLSDD